MSEPINPAYKYALVIGINYIGTAVELKGCINDTNNIVNYLTTKCGYLKRNIKVLTDNEPLKPNSLNIDVEITKLVNCAIYNGATELFLSYSGHGTYVRDLNGDEKDGRDECIVPLDYKRTGFIKDDRLNLLIRKMPVRCKMYCLFDSCFSGTVLDLTSPPGVTGNVVMISGCTDNQTSSESLINGSWSGVMTTCFLDSIAANETQRVNEGSSTSNNLNLNFSPRVVQQMKEMLKSRGHSQTPLLSWGTPNKIKR